MVYSYLIVFYDGVAMYLLDLLKEIPDTRGKQGREFQLADILFMTILGAACGYLFNAIPT